ncbi:MAG: pectate lyase [Sphingomonadales bacterium]|nr:pectate lyase [Sphingomonadales bacterium]MBK9269088.1 pectate lyase [Sphingomonadales bacterium]
MQAIVCALFFCCLTAATPAPQPAFDGAEGAGRFAAGGRGGQTIYVTNLDDDGPGSLRAAINSKGPRTIRFSVSGTIRLKSALVIREPRITLTGEGAPAGGIAIADYPLVINADDVIIRYFRSRLGDHSKVEGDAISIAGGRRIILDHVSASWSIDETLSASARYSDTRGIYDLTVQWSIIAESLRKGGHAKGDHGYGSLVRGGRGARFSFHHNLWAHHVQRMPRPGNYASIAEDPEGPLIEFRSNVFYNWGGSASGYNADKNSHAAYSFIDNAYISGPDSKGGVIFREENPYAHSWFSGNSLNGVIPADPWSFVQGAPVRLKAPLDVAPVRVDPAPSAYARVLDKAGASRPRDSVDERIVADVRARSGRIIDSQAEVGGWPDLAGMKN